jgi:hypothetical protein
MEGRLAVKAATGLIGGHMDSDYRRAVLKANRKLRVKSISAKRKAPSSLGRAKEVAGKKERHPIEKSVESVIHAIMDVRVCSANYIPAARLAYEAELQSCVKRLEKLGESLAIKKEKAGTYEINELAHTARSLKRIGLSRSPLILQESLFVTSFSAFDRFVGDLMVALFFTKKELFKSINHEVPFKEMLEAESLDDIKRLVLASEIEDLRRQSYVDQFKWLERFFDIKLREWIDWSSFVEASQRRNLYVHCDGVVSEQYLKVCDSVEFKFGDRPKLGQRLKLEDNYFYRVTNVIMDAAVMLAHTLWRKVVPEEIQSADDALVAVVYDFLQGDAWEDALRLGAFHVSQRAFSSELNKRIAVINLAIAYKQSGKKQYDALLKKYDWSSSLPEFTLAIKVLHDDFVGAAEVMRSIGRSGKLLSEIGYHQWPLFRDFRQSQDFMSAYADIFGKPFAEAVTQEAKEAAAHMVRPELTGSDTKVSPRHRLSDLARGERAARPEITKIGKE